MAQAPTNGKRNAKWTRDAVNAFVGFRQVQARRNCLWNLFEKPDGLQFCGVSRIGTEEGKAQGFKGIALRLRGGQVRDQ
jgi:hypothetical protein